MTKNSVKNNLLILFVLLLVIGSINFFMDPFWCFEHSHRYNSVQKATNERQQKANYIYFTSNQYDTLLLGSSRTTYMNRHAFKRMNVYNFSAPAMRPQEYITYIDFTINDAKQPIQRIIIGTDFFGYLDYGSFMFKNAPNIVKTTQSPYYRWKVLFSFDALENSFKNVRDYLNPTKHTDRYDRDNVKSRIKIIQYGSKKEQLFALQQDALAYARGEYSSQPNKNYYNIMKTIKNNYKNKEFIIYTTPVTEVLLQLLIEKGHYNNYENWLRTLVNIYGTVYHFMYINPMSKDYINNFADCNHAYPELNAIVAQKITTKCQSEPKDFGVILTSSNIEYELKKLRIINGIK